MYGVERRCTFAGRAVKVPPAMSFPSLLLRILLSVTLLVSGTGNAVAALQMHVAQSGAPHHGHAMEDADCAAPAPPARVASATCHDENAAAPEALHGNGHCQPDCCAAGHCDGFCAQQAPATMPAAWPGHRPRARASLAGHLTTAHPAPPLPSPQRPPIA